MVLSSNLSPAALRLAGIAGSVRETQLLWTGKEAREPGDVPNCSGALQQKLEESLTPEHHTDGFADGANKNQM